MVFYVLFFGHTAFLAILVSIVSLFTKKPSPVNWAIAKFWASSILFLLRWVVGIRSEISGMENIPEGGCIIAAKHQSDWDIFAIFPNTEHPAFIVKKELMDIPFFGWAAGSLEGITIDRKKGRNAIPDMNASAKSAVAKGCRIIIFPEGTRKPALAEPNYRIGAAKLYEKLQVPVVPVALNSGLFWSRNALILWPGLAKAEFLPAIPPGLSIAEMQARMTADIEAASNRLILEAAAEGLTRPIDAEFRARLDALKLEADRKSAKPG